MFSSDCKSNSCKKNSYLTEIEKFENRNSLASHPPEIMAYIGSVLILFMLLHNIVYVTTFLLCYYYSYTITLCTTLRNMDFFFFSFMESWTVDRSHPIIETLDF